MHVQQVHGPCGPEQAAGRDGGVVGVHRTEGEMLALLVSPQLGRVHFGDAEEGHGGGLPPLQHTCSTAVLTQSLPALQSALFPADSAPRDMRRGWQCVLWQQQI